MSSSGQSPAPLASQRPVAIVTGGKQGLGLACAGSLLEAGFDVAVCDVQEPDAEFERLRATAESLSGRLLFTQLDLAAIDTHAGFLDQVELELGPVNCLVNNAGIAARPLTDVLDLQPDAFDASIDVNLRGTFFLSQQVARRMIAAPVDDGRRRSIIVVTSVAAEIPSLTRPQYCIAKSGLSMVVKLLALKLAEHGIDVHEIRPGLMRTAMTASAGTAALDAAIRAGRVPAGRWGEAADVATAVASLATGRLPYMTGQPLWIAGGLNIPRAT